MKNTKQKYHNKYRIPSARADWHDYNGGAYFITICTKNREHFFGEIANGEMILSEIGEYADKNISEITQHNCYAEIPLWIVMPDHIHMVVCVQSTLYGRDVPWRVSTNGKNKTMQEIANKQNRLATIIGGFKQSVTRFARIQQPSFAWQERYYDRIIRNQGEMNRIAEYIANNVAKWCEGLKIDY